MQHRRRTRAATCVGIAIAAVIALAFVAPTVADAFDTGPHYDLTGDALAAEGFGRDAVRVAQINNWFGDLYVNAKDVPQSGHASWWKTLLGARWYLLEIERWDPNVIAAATAMHFDSNAGGLGYRRAQDVEREWQRLLTATIDVCRGASSANPVPCLAALGASLHQVQDFYSHTNWVEPMFGQLPGYDGPGWESREAGTVPTWFDLPPAERNPARSRVYTNGPPDDPVDYTDRLFNRGHGSWRSDANKNLATKMNKDWPGRPKFLEAYMAAYFATRQWAQAVERGVANAGLWNAMRAYTPATATARADLKHDLNAGARGVSYWTGHWQGQGEPTGAADPGLGGSLDDSFFATRRYFARRKTSYRRLYETVVRALRATPPAIPTHTVPHSRGMQESTRFVRVQVMRIRGRGAGDIGPDRADFYAESVVAGRHFLSGFIHGRDSFSFSPPNYPFTFVKAVTAGAAHPHALTDLLVEVKTANVDGAGTDDDVYLRINDAVRFKLDKFNTDDFERNSRSTYSIAVDTTTPFDALPAGYLLRDIRYLQLEKSRDGRHGAWRVGGLAVHANGRVLYRNEAVNRWLSGNVRAWRAPNFTPPGDAQSPLVPVWLALQEADGFIYGGDDHADLHPDYRRKNLGVLYQLDTVVDETTVGGSRHSGSRLAFDGDGAEIRYRIETFKTVPPTEPPPPPPGQPDLVISYLDYMKFTVRNVGTAPAGPFSVTVLGYPPAAFAGLATGAEETRTYASACAAGRHEAIADSSSQVAESNEGNNRLAVDVIC